MLWQSRQSGLREQRQQATCVSLDAQGNAFITRKTVEISAGKEGTKIELTEEAKIAAVVATVAVAVALTVVAGSGAAALLGSMMLATYGLGTVSIGIAVSDIVIGKIVTIKKLKNTKAKRNVLLCRMFLF